MAKDTNAHILGRRSVSPDHISGSKGITYRQWLIGMALQGVLARQTNSAATKTQVNLIVLDQVDDLLSIMGEET